LTIIFCCIFFCLTPNFLHCLKLSKLVFQKSLSDFTCTWCHEMQIWPENRLLSFNRNLISQVCFEEKRLWVSVRFRLRENSFRLSKVQVSFYIKLLVQLELLICFLWKEKCGVRVIIFYFASHRVNWFLLKLFSERNFKIKI
jgi:hypothetical protein